MKKVTGAINLQDERVLQEMFKRFYAQVCLFAGRFLPDDVVADIVQEAFLYMWQHVPVLSGEEAFKSYLYHYVKSKCLNYLRDHRTDMKMEALDEQMEDEDKIDHWIIENELSARILHEIERLPEVRKNIMLMRLEGHSYEEISQELNLNINTLKTHKKQAYRELRGRLADLSEYVLIALLFSTLCF